MAYDSRWRLEFDQLRRQCIREPPPLTRHRLQVGDVDKYARVIKPFHKKWGQWWLWVLLFPALMGLVFWRRLQQCMQTVVQWSTFKNLYRSRKVPGEFVLFLALLHVVLRFAHNLVMTTGDFRRLFQRKAIWREDARYAILSTPLNKTDKDILKINVRLSKFVSRIKSRKNHLVSSIKDHQKIQILRARLFSFFGGLGVYYFVMMNFMLDSSEDILSSFVAATAMIVWPMPFGLMWMVFVYVLGFPFVARLFYQRTLWERQFPGGYFGEPNSGRQILWAMMFICLISVIFIIGFMVFI